MKVQITHMERFEAWYASYPGDPVIRPETWNIEVWVDDQDELVWWLDSRNLRYQPPQWANRRIKRAHWIGTGGVKEAYYHREVLKFLEPSHALLFKLTFA